ncbi:hypothetical protein evm_014446 [Chilo suppressalis]|nr:hypothetical protein evm_014446 [Chilo suppressalis]
MTTKPLKRRLLGNKTFRHRLDKNVSTKCVTSSNKLSSDSASVYWSSFIGGIQQTYNGSTIYRYKLFFTCIF